MAGNGTGRLDSFVDGLFDEDGVEPAGQQRAANVAPVGARMTAPIVPQMPVRGVVGGPQPIAGQGLASLGAGHVTLAKPSAMPTFAPGVLPQNLGAQPSAPGSRPVQLNGPGLIPAHVIPSTVPASGFAGSSSVRPVAGGLGSLQAKVTPPLGSQPVQMPRASPGAVPAQIVAVPTAKLPVGGQVMNVTGTSPQPVSAKAATAALSKPVPSTSAPAPKKQMTSESGASRARNADGSLKDEYTGEEDDEELISRDVEETTAEPIHYGKSTLSEEGMRRERLKDEERKLVNTQVVKAKINSMCSKEGVRASPKLAEAVALALHQRLYTVIDTLVEFSRRRMDLEGDTGASNIVRSSNPRLYLKEQETKRNEEREKRIAEKLAAESGTSALDPSALRRQEEEMNATVLDFAGPARRPRANLAAKLDGTGAGSQHIGMAQPLNADSTGQSYASIKDRNRRITLGDALRFMRQDMHCKHLPLTANTMAGLKIPDSYFASPSQISSSSYSGAPTTTSGGITTRSGVVVSASASSSAGPPLLGNQQRYSQPVPNKAPVSAAPSRPSAPTTTSSTTPTPAISVQRPINALQTNPIPTRSQSKPSPAPATKR